MSTHKSSERMVGTASAKLQDPLVTPLAFDAQAGSDMLYTQVCACVLTLICRSTVMFRRRALDRLHSEGMTVKCSGNAHLGHNIAHLGQAGVVGAHPDTRIEQSQARPDGAPGCTLRPDFELERIRVHAEASMRATQ